MNGLAQLILKLKSYVDIDIDIDIKTEVISKYVFKMCVDNDSPSRKCWLVVLEKLSDTVTNENRKVIDHRYAKYRADKLKVVEIINPDNPDETCERITHNAVINSKSATNTVYVKNEVVIADSYDNDVDNVCANGIHYFRSIEPAYYFRKVPRKHHGKWKSWYRTGQIARDFSYNHGKLHGTIRAWHKNGMLAYGMLYNNGKKYGTQNEWYENGNKRSETTYVNGKKHGEQTKWHEIGQIFDIRQYSNGKMHGKRMKYINNKISDIIEYKNGVIHGEWKKYLNGRILDKITYVNGTKHGKHIKYVNDEEVYRVETYVNDMFMHSHYDIALSTPVDPNGLRISVEPKELQRSVEPKGLPCTIDLNITQICD